MIACAAVGTVTEAPAVSGRAKGASNFRMDEDVHLAHAYVLITTNAAVGTDQDANTFWMKVKENFVRQGGTDARTVMSLKNRFNKVLQFEVNKYVGILHGVLREYKSGWAMNDYVSKAKDVFIDKFGKPFKHEKVYDVLKGSLVKYEIDTSTIDHRVVRALFFIDNDRAVEAERHDTIGVAPCLSVINASASNNESEEDSAGNVTKSDTSSDANVHATPTVAISRPLIGKKKAKMLVAKANKGKKVEVLLTPVVAANAALLVLVKQERNASLSRLAIAAEAKNSLLSQQLNQNQKFQNQQLQLQVYMANPQSEKSIAYFERIMNDENEEVNNRADVVADTANTAVGKTKVNRFSIIDVDNMTVDSSDDESSFILLRDKSDRRPFVKCAQDDDSDVVFVKNRYNPLRDNFGKPMSDYIKSEFADKKQPAKPPVAVYIKREFAAADDDSDVVFVKSRYNPLRENFGKPRPDYIKSEFADKKQPAKPPVAVYIKRECAAADDEDILFAELPETQRLMTALDRAESPIRKQDMEEEEMQDDTQMTSLM